MLSQPPIEPSPETLQDIRNRLGRVCQNYSADEFTALVRQIAVIEAKYEALRIEVFREAARQLASELPRDSSDRPRPITNGSVEAPWR